MYVKCRSPLTLLKANENKGRYLLDINDHSAICHYLGLLLFFSDYHRFPDSFRDRDTLVDAIHPNKNYIYWEYKSGGDDFGQHRYTRGKKPKGLIFKDPGDGIFHGCLPGRCYSYICYVDNGEVKYVTTAKQFKDFVGAIDNIEEAVLLAEVTWHVSIDEESRGGSYFQKDTVYNLQLMKFVPCPFTRESIYFRIEKNSGIVQKKSLGIYSDKGGCIMY